MKITKYTQDKYNQAIKLKNQGLGSLRISKILRLKSRSAVEEWINRGRQPYYFSKKRINWSSSEKNKERIRRLNKITQPKATKISAELRTKRLPESAKKLSEELAYILGVIYGDGHVSIKQRRVILSATDKDFVLNFRDNLEKWSNFKARFYKRDIKTNETIKNRKSQYVSYIDSIEASKFFNDFNLNLIKNSDDKIKINFIKGFFDSEGSISKGILIYNSDKNLLIFISELLVLLKIRNSIKSYKINNNLTNKVIDYHILRVFDKELFSKLINSSIKRKSQKLVTV